MNGMAGHQTPHNESSRWITPRHFIGALGPFDLDPCADADQPWPTAKTMVKEAGLWHDWSRHGRVWLNPPYGKALDSWMKAMAMHDNGIALIFARTETETFFKWVWPYASALLFLNGRVWFHRPCGKRADNNGGAPSVLIAYGADNAQKLWDSKLPGAFVWNQRLVLPINPD